jgi:polyisoprenoid-binding protein YceI
MTVDAGHSSVIFRIRHADVANFYGVFRKVSGEVSLDEKDLAGSSVAIEVDAASVDTRDEGRDRHLRNPDFLDVKQFPAITFKSRSVARKGEDFEVAGDFTLRGVTKPLTATVRKTGAGELNPRMGYRAGYEADFTFKRSDFGMTYGLEGKALGDEIRILFSLETVPKK